MSEDIKKQLFKKELFKAIDNSDTDFVIHILDTTNPDNINVVDKYGQTPLMHAVIEINTILVKYLLDKGAKVGIKDLENKTAMHIAIDYPIYDEAVEEIKKMIYIKSSPEERKAYRKYIRLQHSALIKHGSNEKPNGLTNEESMAHNAVKKAPKNLARHIFSFLDQKNYTLNTPAKGGKRTLKRRKLRNKMSRRKSQRKSQRKSHRLSRH